MNPNPILEVLRSDELAALWGALIVLLALAIVRAARVVATELRAAGNEARDWHGTSVPLPVYLKRLEDDRRALALAQRRTEIEARRRERRTEARRRAWRLAVVKRYRGEKLLSRMLGHSSG